MHGIHTHMEQRQLASGDGTLVSYYVAGKGPAMVLAPGLGTPIEAWKYVFEGFAKAFTIYTWDPRGTYTSAVPADPEALRVEDHVADMEALVAKEGLDTFVLIGWSMGVQISLEYIHRHPERVRALVLLSGAYERVLSTAFEIPGAERLLTLVVRALRPLIPFAGRHFSEFVARPVALRIMHRLKIVTNNLEWFGTVARAFSGLDWEIYTRMILHLNRHSAAPYLREVRTPTLIVAGTLDRITPLATAEHMHREIPDSELYVLPNATHYLLIEYFAPLNARVERFLRRHGLAS